MDNKKEEIKKTLEEIEKGMENILESDNYKKYLDFASSFYNYSPRNIYLILSQMPNAKYIGSYTFWKSKNRYVKKGEHGIHIIAPIITKRKQEPVESKSQEKEINSKTNNTPSTEKELVLTGFRFVTVFDISQTAGEEIPNILSKLTGSFPISDIIIKTIEDIATLPIYYRDIPYNGFCSDSEIVINNNLSPNQTAKTLIHEYMHHTFHNDIKDYSANRSKYELQAESTAYVVSKHFGLDTSEYSFGYLTNWKQSKSMDEVKEILKTIIDISDFIITKMEHSIQNTYNNLLLEEKEKIIFDLKRNNYIPTQEIIENIHQLNKVTKNSNTLKDIKLLHGNLSSLSSEEQNLIKSITTALRSQDLTPTLPPPSTPSIEI